MTPTDLITLTQATRIMPRRKGKRIATAVLLRWIRSGRLRGWRVAGRWMVSEAEVRAVR